MSMNTLLAHEWLAKTGGSENVFEQMMLAVPDADYLCLWNDAVERFGDVSESRLATSQLRLSKALALPVMPSVWKGVSLKGYERVVCSSHAMSHHLAARASELGLPSYAYVHTPARYIWAPELDRRGNSPLANVGRPFLRRLDRRRSSSRVAYAANSAYIASRIENAWGHSAKVIYPCVDTARLQSVPRWADLLSSRDQERLAALPDGFILGASRFVDYKRLDVAIRVGELLGRGVVLAGGGPDEKRLRELASAATVEVVIVQHPSDELLYAAMQEAALFVFMAIEDFGIMPVESIALGTPALVCDQGGAAEIIAETEGGAFAALEDKVELAKAAERAINIDMANPTQRAQRFSNERFRTEISAWVDGPSGSES